MGVGGGSTRPAGPRGRGVPGRETSHAAGPLSTLREAAGCELTGD
jgi:hypothetical protein